MESVVIREIQPVEFPLLQEFLYQAIYIPDGAAPPPRSVTALPALQVYIEAFGSRLGDCCLVAAAGRQVVGAAWSRIMDDYGHIDDGTPSLAISLLPGYRGRGIGTKLLSGLLSRLQKEGVHRVSLSVQKGNPAIRLYQRMGFRTVDERDSEWLMVRDLLDTDGGKIDEKF